MRFCILIFIFLFSISGVVAETFPPLCAYFLQFLTVASYLICSAFYCNHRFVSFSYIFVFKSKGNLNPRQILDILKECMFSCEEYVETLQVNKVKKNK